MISPQKILDKSSFFAFLDSKNKTKLAHLAITKTYAKGSIIFRQNDPVPGVFIVVEGSIRIFKNNIVGKEHVLHLVEKNEVFAEVAVMGGFPCPASAEALTETTCLILPTEDFRQILTTDHALCLQMLSSMASRMRQIVNHVEGIVLKESLNRVADYLVQEYEKQGENISLPSFKKHLACHLNLTSETLSRVLRQLRSDDLISETKNNKFEIKNIEGLREAAQC